jgi:hypothetical protein
MLSVTPSGSKNPNGAETPGIDLTSNTDDPTRGGDGDGDGDLTFPTSMVIAQAGRSEIGNVRSFSYPKMACVGLRAPQAMGALHRPG